ncbi:small acid-soluble spore protein SspI [Paenibacillus tarimensis]
MNNLNLRQAIIMRVHDKSQEDLRDVIEGSIGDDERTLPGLGVLFELIWQKSDLNMQKAMIESLHSSLQSQPSFSG